MRRLARRGGIVGGMGGTAATAAGAVRPPARTATSVSAASPRQWAAVSTQRGASATPLHMLWRPPWRASTMTTRSA